MIFGYAPQSEDFSELIAFAEDDETPVLEIQGPCGRFDHLLPGGALGRHPPGGVTA